MSPTFLTSSNAARNLFVSSTFEVPDDGGRCGELASLAAHEIERGDFAEAEGLLQQGLAEQPDHAGCLAAMAVCMAALGRGGDMAEQMARQVIDKHPDDPAGWFALAQVHLLGGERKTAFQHFATARDLAGRDRRFKARVDRQDPRQHLVSRALPRDHMLNVALGRLRMFFLRRKNG